MEGKSKQLKTYLLILAGAAFLLAAAALDSHADIVFQSFRTHSHVVLGVDPDVDYSVEKIEKDGKVVALRLKLSNVGEDPGDLRGVSDDRTERVRILRRRSEKGPSVTYDFILSPEAVAAGVDYFNFRSKVPNQIQLDFWLKALEKEKATTAAASGKAKGKTAALRGGARRTVKAAPRIDAKKQAPGLPAFAGCGEPLRADADGFPIWKVYHKPFAYRNFFNLMPADAGYEYPFSKPLKGENLGARKPEISHYRLAHKLYKESQYALVLRTIEFFDARYPQSKLRGEIQFLRASTLVQLSRLLRTDRYMDQAFDVYRKIVIEEPGSPKARQSLAFLVQELMDRGRSVQALEYALMGAEAVPAADGDPLALWVYRLASAEALYSIGEYDRAERAYQLVMEQGNRISPEAAFRMGEIYVQRKFLDRAVLAFERAIKDYPEQSTVTYPTTWFNLAEAYFRLGRYDESAKTYARYMEIYSADEFTWAAELRLAEMRQIALKTADPKRHADNYGAYEHVINRHPYTPGSMMAELRLAQCSRNVPGDPNRDFFLNFFQARELKKFESTIVEPSEVETWMDLAEARYHLRGGEFRQALKRADEYRPKLDLIPLGPSFREAYAAAVAGEVAKPSPSADELLAFHEHFGDLAPKPESFGYGLALLKALQGKLDLNGMAAKLSELQGRIAGASAAEKDEFHVIKAGHLRLLGEKPVVVAAELGKIRDAGELAGEKYDGLARAALDSDDNAAALAADLRLIEGGLERGLPVDRRMAIHVRYLETLTRQGGQAKAVARLAGRDLIRFGVNIDFQDYLNRMRDLRAQALYDDGQFKEAAAALDEILVARPEHPRQSELEFMRAKSYLKTGREPEAEETFRRLASAPKDDFWKRSAQAELDQLQWESKMSNLIKEKDRRSSQ